jgi:hypothetical protein
MLFDLTEADPPRLHSFQRKREENKPFVNELSKVITPTPTLPAFSWMMLVSGM